MTDTAKVLERQNDKQTHDKQQFKLYFLGVDTMAGRG